MKMKLKDGKTKVLTLSYDDGVVQDIRLIEILNKYGIKATFNINTGVFVDEDTVREEFKGNLKLSEAKALYTNSGHEIAVHSLTHPFLEHLDSAEIIHEIIEDRKNIEREFGVIARGMAYPFGTYNSTVIDVLKNCQIAYSRTCSSTNGFMLPQNWLTLNPTCHHNSDRLWELAEKFVKPSALTPWGHVEMFYLWGHSYEFDGKNNWDLIEKFAEFVGGRDDIWYATNIEIYDYVMAYKSLRTSYDKKIIHNPSAIDVWFEMNEKIYCIEGGKTLTL